MLESRRRGTHGEGGAAKGEDERPAKQKRTEQAEDLDLSDGAHVHSVAYKIPATGPGMAFVLPQGPPPLPTAPSSAAGSDGMRHDEWLPNTEAARGPK